MFVLVFRPRFTIKYSTSFSTKSNGFLFEMKAVKECHKYVISLCFTSHQFIYGSLKTQNREFLKPRLQLPHQPYEKETEEKP